jgi:hypothetical protein
MKKIAYLFLLCIYINNIVKAQTTEFKGVTVGVGLGYSYLTSTPKDYFLTTDASHKLQAQDLSQSSIVVSSMLSIKLGKVGTQTQEKNGVAKNQLVSLRRYTENTTVRTMGGNRAMANKDDITYDTASFKDRLSLHLSLNLAEINSNNVSFNKAIDGGIGIGYLVNDFTQIALFYDMIRVRQLRDFFVTNYLNQSGIPTGNGTEVYNALDEKDKNLFYSKYYSGISFKIIFTLGNK